MVIFVKFDNQYTYPFPFKKKVTAIIIHITSRFDLYVLLIIIIILKVNIFPDCITARIIIKFYDTNIVLESTCIISVESGPGLEKWPDFEAWCE